MSARHLEILVEEPSMEAFLRILLRRILPEQCSFAIHPFQCKNDLLKKLEARLMGYRHWLPDDWRIVILIDRDSDNCVQLRRRLDAIAEKTKLPLYSSLRKDRWQIANRLAIEELEAWYFGDWEAVHEAYPNVPATIAKRKPFRNPDAISGGTWESFERILSQHGYFTTGLRKVEVARKIAARMDPARNCSKSFQKFITLLEAASI